MQQQEINLPLNNLVIIGGSIGASVEAISFLEEKIKTKRK